MASVFCSNRSVCSALSQEQTVSRGSEEMTAWQGE